ncbi:unnamed protein product [Paramecium pentaurelia]|uniref:Uncharacterized protein n=1 Tax=Paramecium pentaurelia TaxID=43138 RepID=A0A8S1X7V9_9CILI|nr:unnamed protein product [Paramecium pentaurelia]
MGGKISKTKVRGEGQQGDILETNDSTNSNISNQQSQQKQNDIIVIKVLCSRCKRPLANNDYFLQNCGQNQCQVKFHQACFFKELNDQNTKKEVLSYKCQCGTKIPLKILRKCGAPNLLDLLSSIHRRQIEILLKLSTLRKNQEILSYFSENKQKTHEFDYFLSEQDQLIYDETPQ